MSRIDGRTPDQLRPVRIVPGFFPYAEGSALIEMGNTKVAVAVTVEDRVPPFLRGRNQGWLTAEYSMLPRATQQRTQREVNQGRVGGRTQEIQRLVGRALRAVTDLSALGERTILIDCDVLQADGGTRTASITGAYVALHLALQRMVVAGTYKSLPLKGQVAAVSVGVIGGEPMLDLCYEEDSHADVDFNVVMTDRDEFVELQGTAEGDPFSMDAMQQLVGLARKGIGELVLAQRAAVAAP